MTVIKKVKNQKEYETCLMIRKAVFIDEQNVPEDREVDCFENTSLHFLAYYNKQPAGTGRFRVKKNFIKFERIAVLKTFRGKKIGKKLLQTMQEVAKKEYPSYQIMAEVQVRVTPFYQKLGWKVIGKTFWDAGIEHQKMVF